MKKSLILDTAHLFLKNEINRDDIILDMTMGNGHDTLFISKLSQHVYAFDIQDQAIEETKKRLSDHHITHVNLIKDDHFNFDSYVDTLKGAIFNLGYLPGGNKEITTSGKHTVDTTKKCLTYLQVGGFILFVVYVGHEEGKLESESLSMFLESLDPSFYKILKVEMPFIKNNPPYIYMIYKLKSEA
jgi:hypothetical protein